MTGSQEGYSDKKEQGGTREKWHRDPVSGVFTGLIVIMLGISLFFATRGFVGWEKWWAYFLLGVGCIFLVESLVRYRVPAYRRPIFGKVFAGLILICIGAANAYGIREWWPLLIIAVGLAIVLYGVHRTRKRS